MPCLRTSRVRLAGVLGLLFALAGPLRAGLPGSMGTDFWLAFTPNYIVSTTTLSLYITSATGATGTVSCPGLGFSIPFTVDPNASIQVPVTLTSSLGDGSSLELTENKGIEVSSNNPISVYGMDNQTYSSDAYLALPNPQLGTNYFVLSYEGLVGSDTAVVAPSNGTVVTVTLPMAFNGHSANTPYTVDLNQGQTYFLWANGGSGGILPTGPDFTGTRFQSNNPIVVYGGNECANIPVGTAACDYLVEEMFPVPLWGTSYLSVPLGTRKNGDTFRVLASQNNTSFSINGVNIATLGQGAYWEGMLSVPSQIVASAPVIVGQYANGGMYDNDLNGDPSEMQLQPLGRYSSDYIIAPDQADFSRTNSTWWFRTRLWAQSPSTAFRFPPPASAPSGPADTPAPPSL